MPRTFLTQKSNDQRLPRRRAKATGTGTCQSEAVIDTAQQSDLYKAVTPLTRRYRRQDL
jgi:hypothetical protein